MYMEIINTTNINQARTQIQKLKNENKEAIVFAQDDVFNRKMLENKNVDILLSPELHNRKGRLKQRDSGMNEIHCRLAKKNNIKIGIDLSKIKKLPKKEKAIVLARIIQNINLCKRTKTQIVVFPKGKYKKQDVMSFFVSLGSSTKQARDALQ